MRHSWTGAVAASTRPPVMPRVCIRTADDIRGLVSPRCGPGAIMRQGRVQRFGLRVASNALAFMICEACMGDDASSLPSLCCEVPGLFYNEEVPMIES